MSTEDHKAVDVRPATLDDIDEVFELAAMMALTFTPERKVFGASYRSVLDDQGAHLLVVDVGDTVAGYLLAFEHHTFFANGPVAWVEEIAVRSDLRRRGLGGLLMKAYEQAVSSRRGRLVALATTRAGHFYEALGYTSHATYYRKLLR